MQKHRIARLVIAATLGLGALLFAKVYLIDGWGRMPLNGYIAMACAIFLMTLGSIGLIRSENWGRIAGLAFFYYALVFALILPSIVTIVMSILFIVALHAMAPKRMAKEQASIED